MSAQSYENSLIEGIKQLEEETRETRKIVKQLKKKKRKQKRLTDEEEEMLAIYIEELDYANQEIDELIKEKDNINYREEEEEELVESYTY